jgi:ABC-type branched-subunit amino acid transport system ATPase component
MEVHLLEVEDVHKRFGGLAAVAGATFCAPPGRITALVGPNGAGKTTVFNIISGFIAPDAGRVRFQGRDITRLRPHLRARLRIARTFQDVRIFEQLTVEENLLLGLAARRGERLWQALLAPWVATEPQERARVHEVLEAIGLPEAAGVRADELSYGDQKLVAIGRALMASPQLLLLDEPTSGLDERAQRRVLSFLKGLASSERNLVIVEHNMRVVEALADHVIFMHEGAVLAEGTLDGISNDSRLAEIYFGTGEARPDGAER